MKWFLVPRLMITLAISLPLGISLEPSEVNQVQTTSLAIKLQGEVTSGVKCDQSEAFTKLLLNHDCSNDDATQRQSIPIHTSSDGSFSTSLTVSNQGVDKTRNFCSLVLCRDKDRNVCSNAIIRFNKEENEMSSDLQRKVKFCFIQKSTSKRSILRQLSKRSPWSEDDLNWLKRSGTQKSNYNLSDLKEKVSGEDRHSGLRPFVAEGGRPRRLWEGAEDEVGWMKRNDRSEIGRGSDWSYERHNPAANQEQQKKWKESDMAWL